MGGGAAVRAAAKVAGIGVVNSGIRGGFANIQSPAEQSVRNVSRPVSAFLSSSSSSSSLPAGGVDIAGGQRPAWELDDWEFAGVEEAELVGSGDPLPRVVFGPAPTLQEAKDATNELKDALEKLSLASSAYTGQLSDSTLLANSNYLETKSCIACEPRSPRYAMKAFALLNKSPEAQSIVASIAADPNVWEAVLKNEALQGYLESQKTESGEDAELSDLRSPEVFSEFSDKGSQARDFENKPKGIFERIKETVSEMVNNVSTFVEQVFGFSAADNVSAAGDGKSQSSFFDKNLGASFMALAVMVIMVVLLKRG